MPLPNTTVVPAGWAAHHSAVIDTPTTATTVAILRGTTTDGYGDESESDTATIAGVPAKLVTHAVRSADPTTGAPRIDRITVATVPPATDVRVGDRIKDESTGTVYVLSSFYPLIAPLHEPGIHLDLARAYEGSRQDV